MLHLIPAPLHRLLYRLADAVRWQWWRIVRPTLTGCRAVAVDGEGRVLLVRHSYGSHDWLLPGGGIGRGEDPVAAARRELHEETGCALENARLAATVVRSPAGATNRVHIVVGKLAGTPRPDGREIVSAELFAPDFLPDDMQPWVRDGLPGWIRAATVADRPAPAPPPAPPPAPTG